MRVRRRGKFFFFFFFLPRRGGIAGLFLGLGREYMESNKTGVCFWFPPVGCGCFKVGKFFFFFFFSP